MKVKTFTDVDPDKLDEKANKRLEKTSAKVVHTNVAAGQIVLLRTDRKGKTTKEERLLFVHSI